MIPPVEFVRRIAAVLEKLGIPYHVGGSFASSAHGMYRASADVDFVIDPTAEQLESLRRILTPDFYVSESAVREALRDRSTFNAVHTATSFKIDFFIKGTSAFDAEELRRSVPQAIDSADPRPVLLKSAEDTILRKLDWYRRGGEASDRQWQDVRSILAAARGTLDEEHLDHWARELGVGDLLEKARREAAEI